MAKSKVTLKEARKNAGLTIEQIAEKMGRNRSTIMNWESGKTLPTLLQAKELSDFYKISIDCIDF